MAKKNSTKTATKEALQASEPRLQQFSQWKGINFSLAPHSWSDSPYDAHDPSTWPAGDHHNQSDLPANYFMVQNNIRMEDNGSVETRNETLSISDSSYLTQPPYSPTNFTGVTHMVGGNLFVAAENGNIYVLDVGRYVDISGRKNASTGISEIKTKTASPPPASSMNVELSTTSSEDAINPSLTSTPIRNVRFEPYSQSWFDPDHNIADGSFGIKADITYRNEEDEANPLTRTAGMYPYIAISSPITSATCTEAFFLPTVIDGHQFYPSWDRGIEISPQNISHANPYMTMHNIVIKSDMSKNTVNASSLRSCFSFTKGTRYEALARAGVISLQFKKANAVFLPGIFADDWFVFRDRPSVIDNYVSQGNWWIEGTDADGIIISIRISSTTLLPQGASATESNLSSAFYNSIVLSGTAPTWSSDSGICIRDDYSAFCVMGPGFNFVPANGDISIQFKLNNYAETSQDYWTTKLYKSKIEWDSFITNWHQVIVEKAPDRDLTKPIIWDSINDVLGDLICFGHYVDDNGNNIYNIYRQIPPDSSDPEGTIRIKAYAAIPDPNKELEVGYIRPNDSTNTIIWVPMSEARVGFARFTKKWDMDAEQSKTTNEEEDLLGGWGEAPTVRPDAIFQYFRSVRNIDDPIYGDNPWGSDGRPVVGSGNLGTRFETPEDGGMPDRICISLPVTQIVPNDNEGFDKHFQQSPMALWVYESGYDRYSKPDGQGAAQYIKCYDADGETQITTLDEFPPSFMFPIVTTSKTATYFGPKTLRCVDPIDAEAMDLVEDDATARVFHRSGASYLNNEVYPFRYSFCYVYTNPLGHTLASQWRTVYANLAAEDLSTATGAFRITQWVPENDDLHDYDSLTGVDIFYTKDDYKTMAFAGHVDFPEGGPAALVGRQWIYDWYGGSSDTTEWSNAGLTLPDENTTRGPECEWMDYIDNKCYFYGGARKYRLYIGGRVGHELCTTASVGGGWLDINPGSGVELKKVLKFKTYNGANIVTILASHANHRYVRRYNLIQNNIAITNELTRQGYSFEEVSNVVGAISHWGAGVWAEGLYTLSRYGLCLTTQQMENTNNLRAQIVSEPISPIFTEGIAANMHRSEMIFSDDKIYFVLSTHDLKGEVLDPSEIIFCYDVNAKGWYTYTLDGETNILSVFNFDYEGNKEGIGVITPTKIYLIPNAGIEDNAWPTPADKDDFVFHTDRSILETGELALRTPPSTYQTLSQLEFRFDYFIGDVTIDVTGVDYYGRHFNVKKEVHEHDLVTEYPVYVRVDKLLQTYNVRMEGYAHYRLTHILTKTYPESNKIDLVYGFDDSNRHENRVRYDSEGNAIAVTEYPAIDHHYIRNYNNLRECIVP